MSITPEEIQTIEALHNEIQFIQSQGPIVIEIDAASAFSLIGLLQLAMRHPGLTEHNRETGRSFVERISVIFPPGSVAHGIIQQGYQEEYDKEVPEEVKTLLDFGKKLVNDLNESDPEYNYEIIGVEEYL